MALNWHFKELDADSPDDTAVVERNFRRESTELPEILVRELIQNVLDARNPKAEGPVRVVFKVLNKDNGLNIPRFQDVIQPLEMHLEAANHPKSDGRDYENPKVLVVEEFGTVGLTGKVDDSRSRGDGERWANFFHGEARRAKTGKNLGRAGQGKITYHMASAARSVLVLSRREESPEVCVFGKCIVQASHKIGSEWFIRHGYWWKADAVHGKQPLPETDISFCAQFAEDFLLTRGQADRGTSWIIPFPHPSITKQSLLYGILKDFHFSILKGALEVDVCGESINASNVISHVKHLIPESVLSGDFAAFLEKVASEKAPIVALDDWKFDGDTVSPSSFTSEDLDRIKDRFADEGLVAVRFPVKVTKSDRTCAKSYFDVFLSANESLKRSEELYIRSGLVIADEKWLKDSPGKALGVMLAEDDLLSELLGYAEEASHLKWNAAEADLAKYYSIGEAKDVLARVRRSLPRLHRLLAGHKQKLEEDALAHILSVPSVTGGKKGAVTAKPSLPKNSTSATVKVTNRKPKLLQITDIPTGVRISSTKEPVKVGQQILATFAYERVQGEGDPFSSYHPFDFDVADPMQITVTLQGVKCISSEENKLRVSVDDTHFSFEVTGFSDQQRLICKARVIATRNTDSEETEAN